jgi:hypothetical protein
VSDRHVGDGVPGRGFRYANPAYDAEREADEVLAWLLHGFTLLAAVATLWIFSVPGAPDVFWFFFVALAWLALGLVWLVRTIGAVGFRRDLRAVPHLLVEPVIVLLVAVLVKTSVPLWARFEVSRGAMNGLARQVSGAPDAATFRSRRVGLYTATRIEPIPGGMRFLVRSGSGLLDESAGFAYSPSGPPAATNEPYDSSSYEHLSGPWYVWTLDAFGGGD